MKYAVVYIPWLLVVGLMLTVWGVFGSAEAALEPDMKFGFDTVKPNGLNKYLSDDGVYVIETQSSDTDARTLNSRVEWTAAVPYEMNFMRVQDGGNKPATFDQAKVELKNLKMSPGGKLNLHLGPRVHVFISDVTVSMRVGNSAFVGRSHDDQFHDIIIHYEDGLQGLQVDNGRVVELHELTLQAPTIATTMNVAGVNSTNLSARLDDLVVTRIEATPPPPTPTPTPEPTPEPATDCDGNEYCLELEREVESLKGLIDVLNRTIDQQAILIGLLREQIEYWRDIFGQIRGATSAETIEAQREPNPNDTIDNLINLLGGIHKAVDPAVLEAAPPSSNR